MSRKEAYAKARSKVADPRDLRNDKYKLVLRIKANATESKKLMMARAAYLSHFSPPCATISHVAGALRRRPLCGCCRNCPRRLAVPAVLFCHFLALTVAPSCCPG